MTNLIGDLAPGAIDVEFVDAGETVKQVVILVGSDLLHSGTIAVQVPVQPGRQLTWGEVNIKGGSSRPSWGGGATGWN